MKGFLIGFGDLPLFPRFRNSFPSPGSLYADTPGGRSSTYLKIKLKMPNLNDYELTCQVFDPQIRQERSLVFGLWFLYFELGTLYLELFT